MNPQESIARDWTLLLVCFSAFIATTYGDCVVPGRSDFATLDSPFNSQDSFLVGTTVTYTCVPGYSPIPGISKNITCLSNSTWSTLEMFCKLKSCGDPGDIENGEVHFESVLFGSRATYTCNPGYNMISKKNYRECEASGLWSNEKPVCEAQICGPPYPITDGSYTPEKEEYVYQDTVKYECSDKKFTLIGEAFLTCTMYGNWSFDAPKCTAVECSSPEVENARKLSGFNGPYYFDSAVRFECSPGFTMKGSDLVKCNASSKWAPSLPTCNVQGCKPPNRILDGSFSPSKEEYANNEVVTYQCNDKQFTLTGQPSLSCTTFGNWSSDPPKCIAVECPRPDVANAIQLSGPSGPYYFNVSVTFECSPGFTMKGANLVRCSVNSQWDPQLPTCSPVECTNPKVANAVQLSGFSGPYYFNVSVQFECSPGFVMRGANLVRCNVHNQWDPPLPTCSRSSAVTLMGNCIIFTIILLGHLLIRHV